jgi:hypothetical protein
MKQFIFQVCIILILGISSSFAGSMMLQLHVGSFGGTVGPDPCAGGTLDLTKGCPLPMLGVF